MKNDEAQPSPEAAREEFFRGVEPEAAETLLPASMFRVSGGSEDRQPRT